jgi:hypothetical protein
MEACPIQGILKLWERLARGELGRVEAAHLIWPAGFYLTLKATLCFGNNAFDFKKTYVAPIGRHTRTSSE